MLRATRIDADIMRARIRLDHIIHQWSSKRLYSSCSSSIHSTLGTRNATRILMSNIFAPMLKEVPQDAVMNSHILLTRSGLIRQSSSGIYTYLPLAQRTLSKIKNIVEDEMCSIGAQRMCLPALSSASDWIASGRWETVGTELFRLDDRRGAQMCLSPTCEEVITSLVDKDVSTYRQLPLRLFQIETKFRDEMRPRFGLLRAREFIMKDMYTFDADNTMANHTYDQVSHAYGRVLSRLDIKYVRVEASCGEIGGLHSHEFHVPCSAGEEDILICQVCSRAVSAQKAKLDSTTSSTICTTGSTCNFVSQRGLEIAHIFHLGTRYSLPLQACFKANDGTQHHFHMGCYGIGISRAFAAIVETHHDKRGICWPIAVAPYRVLIISSGDNPNNTAARQLYDDMQGCVELKYEVILDERDDASIGKKFGQANLLGIPLMVVVGREYATSGRVEIQLRHGGEDETIMLPLHEVLPHVHQLVKKALQPSAENGSSQTECSIHSSSESRSESQGQETMPTL